MNSSLKQNLLSLPNYALNLEVEDLQTRIKNCTTIALQYTCQSWHNHLTETREDVGDVVSSLLFFLEKFLAWLKVVSILGATRGGCYFIGTNNALATRGLFLCFLEDCLILIYNENQVAKDKQLLDTTKNCFNFVTKFFEVIGVSVTHIYHSALELSPLPSIVQKLYHYNHPTPLPRAVTGIPDSWNQSITISRKNICCEFHSWSPCGQFVAAQAGGFVEIWDSLTLELLHTLKLTRFYRPSFLVTFLNIAPAYSPDGFSLICVFDTAIAIWDIQTGRLAKKIQCDGINAILLVWSMDRGTIGVMIRERGTGGLTVFVQHCPRYNTDPWHVPVIT